MSKVSVIIPSYNHALFIKDAIQSVLTQSYEDFECIVVDDGSKDNSIEVINSIKDPRIKLIQLNKNIGACGALNLAVKQASGDFVSILNSDDLWFSHKLKVQVDYLEANPLIGACFGLADFIDENGNKHFGKMSYKSKFNSKNMSRHEWLRSFFYVGNTLCHPSIMIRRNIYGPFDERLRNLPDLDMWIKICLKCDIHVMNESLVKFRVLSKDRNTSSDRPDNNFRAGNEYQQILNNYLNIKDINEFYKVFPNIEYKTNKNELIPFLLAIAAINAPKSSHKCFGMNLLYTILTNEEILLLLKSEFNLDFPQIHKLTSTNVLNYPSNFLEKIIFRVLGKY
jgi:glycosyltransferase involved in cell wall biosynthesis